MPFRVQFSTESGKPLHNGIKWIQILTVSRVETFVSEFRGKNESYLFILSCPSVHTQQGSHYGTPTSIHIGLGDPR